MSTHRGGPDIRIRKIGVRNARRTPGIECPECGVELLKSDMGFNSHLRTQHKHLTAEDRHQLRREIGTTSFGEIDES